MAGKTLREQAQARGYQLVSDAASLNSVTEANQQKPLLGLFADGNMPVRWLGPKAAYHGNIDKPAVTCTPNPQRNDSVPTLAQMTDKAIELLGVKMRKAFSCKLKVRQSINRIMLRILVGKLARRSISMKPYNGRWNSLKRRVTRWS